MVLDPNLAEHLAHFGIDMLKMQKVSHILVPVSKALQPGPQLKEHVREHA